MENMIPWDGALIIKYEDLIYRYYSTTKMIMDYLGFKERPDCEFKYFNPDISVKYTKAWETYGGHEVEKEKIERELSNYLYEYCDYVPVEVQKQMYGGII